MKAPKNSVLHFGIQSLKLLKFSGYKSIFHKKGGNRNVCGVLLCMVGICITDYFALVITKHDRSLESNSRYCCMLHPLHSLFLPFLNFDAAKRTDFSVYRQNVEGGICKKDVFIKSSSPSVIPRLDNILLKVQDTVTRTVNYTVFLCKGKDFSAFKQNSVVKSLNESIFLTLLSLRHVVLKSAYTKKPIHWSVLGNDSWKSDSLCN